jgi:hypothetical protein
MFEEAVSNTCKYFANTCALVNSIQSPSVLSFECSSQGGGDIRVCEEMETFH